METLDFVMKAPRAHHTTRISNPRARQNFMKSIQSIALELEGPNEYKAERSTIAER